MIMNKNFVKFILRKIISNNFFCLQTTVDTIVDENAMDTSVKAKYSKTTLKDKDGNYPKWLSSRKIQKLKSKGKKSSAGKVSKKNKNRKK